MALTSQGHCQITGALTTQGHCQITRLWSRTKDLRLGVDVCFDGRECLPSNQHTVEAHGSDRWMVQGDTAPCTQMQVEWVELGKGAQDELVATGAALKFADIFETAEPANGTW
jgi:hypothetical protein